MHFKLFPLSAVALALCSQAALAQTAAGFSVSGFGTAGFVKTDTDLAEYVNDLRQKSGATKSADYDVDSKLGVQVTGTLNSSFSGTVQLLARRDDAGSWAPAVEWAYAKARFGGGFTARAGRLGAPFFMVSDFRNVGYANTWIRPPIDVYAQVPLSTFDGADLGYQGDIAGTNATVQLFGGSSKPKYPGGVELDVKSLVGVNASVELGPVTLRVGHLTSKITLQNSAGYNGLIGGLRAASAQPGLGSLAVLADELAADNKTATFSGVGASLDWNDIVGSAEFTKRKNDSYLADTTSWYLTGGYRLGSWTPYLTLSQVKQDSPTSSTAVPPVPALAPLAAGVNSLLRSVGQKTTAVGFRWDAYKNVALKGQFDRIRVDANGSGNFRNVKAGFGADPVQVYSLAVDFVF